MSLLEIIKDMLDKGLITVAKRDGVLAANKLYRQLTILNYTSKHTVPDTYTIFLRTHRQN